MLLTVVEDVGTYLDEADDVTEARRRQHWHR